MREKLKDDKFARELLFKFIFALAITIVALLILNVMNMEKDGRRQIIDEDGATEYEETYSPTKEEVRLTQILSQMKGVGNVDVMISYEEDEDKTTMFQEETTENRWVIGVIVTASGAENPVIKNDIMRAVSTLFDIPIGQVIVFEKNEEVL